jgi:hypothetical protein
VDDQQQGASSLRPQERELQLQQRQRKRERRKFIGLLAIALFILLLTFLRFGKSIPWGAR